MREGWICPACGAGVSPGQSHCEHPPQLERLPEDFPPPGVVALAKASFPTLDIAVEAAKFRQHYGHDRSARWPHVWRRWLEGERKWVGTRQPEDPPAKAKILQREERVRVYVRTAHGARMESSLYVWQYEAMLQQGTAPELVDPAEYDRMRSRAVEQIGQHQAG